MSTERQHLFHKRVKSQPFLVWYRMLRVFKNGVGYISPSITNSELSRPQFDLLSAIAADGGRSQQVYAERMTVTKGNVTQQVQQLEKLGWVARSKEGRKSKLYLTEAGWQKLATVIPAHDELMNEMFSVLSPDDIAQLTRILRKLERNIEKR